MFPASASGIVARTVPAVRRRSGLVNTSSVGMFATWRRPSTVSPPPLRHTDPGIRPTVRSVPGPRKRMLSKARSLSSVARASSFSRCVFQAATGSGSSSRVAAATASQSGSTSGAPNTVCAQPSFGKATIDQLIRRLLIASR